MNAEKRRQELYKLGYVKGIDGYMQPCWCKNREFFSDEQVDKELKDKGKWQDDFDMNKLNLI